MEIVFFESEYLKSNKTIIFSIKVSQDKNFCVQMRLSFLISMKRTYDIQLSGSEYKFFNYKPICLSSSFHICAQSLEFLTNTVSNKKLDEEFKINLSAIVQVILVMNIKHLCLKFYKISS